MFHVPDIMKKVSKILVLVVFLVGLVGLLAGTFLSDDEIISAKVDDDAVEPVVIEFWGISSEDNSNEEMLQQLVNKYNAQADGVHVNLEMKSDRYFYKIFSTAIATQNNPDVSILFCSQAAQFWDKGFLYSLDDAIGQIADEEQFYDKMLVQTSLYKQQFGIPVSFDNYVLLVNKNILNDKGVQIPGNLSEFLDVMQRVSSDDMAGIALPNKGYLASRALMYFILVNGGSLFDQPDQISLAGKENEEIYDFIRTLYEDKLIYDKKTQLSIKDVSDLFSNGETAAVLTSLTELRRIFENTDKEFIKNVEIVTLRGFDDVFHSSGPIFLDVLCVYKNSQHKEKAQLFAKWLCKEYASMWEQDKGNKIPAIVTKNDYAVLNERFTQAYFNDILPNAVFPSYPETNSINYIILEGTDVLNNFLYDVASDADMEELILKYQQELDDWVERFNRYKI